MVKKLAELFRTFGYTWQVDGKTVVPSEKDLEQVLDRAKELLYAEPIPSELEIGHLIIHHWAHGKFDIYLQVGEAND